MGNGSAALISLLFSIVSSGLDSCLFESETSADALKTPGHRRALIMEPCGVNCFLLQISQPVVDVSAACK